MSASACATVCVHGCMYVCTYVHAVKIKRLAGEGGEGEGVRGIGGEGE